MLELRGKYNSAKVYTNQIEETAASQVINLCNQEFVSGSTIRIMPDVHAGAGCTIGTTMTIEDKIVPNLVGVDIGCGMYTVKLGKVDIDFSELDKVINGEVPAGFNVRENKHRNAVFINLDGLNCRDLVNVDRAYHSIGTLGGGNHFIELNKDSDDNMYLVIHSGSRNLGKQVAEHYQKKAYDAINSLRGAKENIVNELKSQGRYSEIEETLTRIKSVAKIPKELAYLEGNSFDDYMHDMKIVQMFATLNRAAIANTIMTTMGMVEEDAFTTTHNYIDTDSKILRKGAISARDGERVLIPINMRDGSIIAVGKGNADWNYSAPHGAGRIMSRSQAKQELSLEGFKAEMSEVYTTSVGESTLDEAPGAYKPIRDIVDNIGETVTVLDVLSPLYNFKAH